MAVKVAVKTFIMLQKTSELLIYLFIFTFLVFIKLSFPQKKSLINKMCHGIHTAVFYIDNKKCFLSTKSGNQE